MLVLLSTNYEVRASSGELSPGCHERELRLKRFKSQGKSAEDTRPFSAMTFSDSNLGDLKMNMKVSGNGSGNRQSLEPSRSRSKSWSSQNNPNQNQQRGQETDTGANREDVQQGILAIIIQRWATTLEIEAGKMWVLLDFWDTAERRPLQSATGSLKMNVILLHYNYTRKIGNQQMIPTNNMDFQQIIFLIICSFI
ncbi:hypothetical protein CCH79_00000983, partial [Gambusia affinis]